MKRFELWNYDKETLKEAVSFSKKEFLDAMKVLYDEGEDEAIEKAFKAASSFEIQKVIDKLFAKKTPNASEEHKGVLLNKISALNISEDEKLEFAKGLIDGTSYDLVGIIKKKGLQDLKSICKKNGALELLPWFLEWKAPPDKGKVLGVASTEMFFILAGKNGKAPPKGDAELGGMSVEIKSNKDEFSYEMTVSGGQQNGHIPRNEWVKQAKSLYQQKKLPWDKEMPFGNMTKVGKNNQHMVGPLTNFCMGLKNAGMNDGQINKWINDTTNKVLLSTGINVNVWDGTNVDIPAFLKLWNACALSYYMAKENFTKLCLVHKKKLQIITISSSKEMLEISDKLSVAAISNQTMPGRNESVSVAKYLQGRTPRPKAPKRTSSGSRVVVPKSVTGKPHPRMKLKSFDESNPKAKKAKELLNGVVTRRKWDVTSLSDKQMDDVIRKVMVKPTRNLAYVTLRDAFK